MAIATGFAVTGIFIFLVAVALPDWATIEFVNVDYEYVHVQLGVWGEWRTVNTTNKAEWISHFPKPPGGRFLRLADADLKHYYRAQAAFCIISIVFMICNNVLALYTFNHHRYMYKRLVACLHVVAALCITVTIEVLVNSVNEWNVQVAQKAVYGDWDYSAARQIGKAVYLSWAVVVIYVLAAIAFANASHKQKGSRAATVEFEIEDRPFHVGRR